ncbi:MAG TPA: hypothetical protein VH638_00820 [Gemmatimonadaceae bacterium]
MADQPLNPRTVVREDGAIVIDGVPVARWRDIPLDEQPHVEREVRRWIERLQSVAQGGIPREERLRRERDALRLVPMLLDVLPDAPEEPHIDLPIAKDVVAYWHFRAR